MIIITLTNTFLFEQSQSPLVQMDNTVIISKSIYYNLQKVKAKMKDIDFGVFKELYRNNSKNKSLTATFYPFVEIIGFFNEIFVPNMVYWHRTHHQHFVLADAQKGWLDLGIVEAILYKNLASEYYVSSPAEGGGGIMSSPIVKLENTGEMDKVDVIIMEGYSNESIVESLRRQRIGGVMVIVIGDCFEYNTAKMLYLLSASYEKTYITKPMSCWNGSSTKYVICNGFKGKHLDITTEALFSFNLTNYFLTKLEELNCIFVQTQIEIIINNYTVLNKPEKRDAMIKSYNQRCFQWFNKHHIEFHCVD